MRKRLWLIVLSAVLLAAAAGVYAYYSRSEPEPAAAAVSAPFVRPTPEPTPEPTPTPVPTPLRTPVPTPTPAPTPFYDEVWQGLVEVNGDVKGVLEWGDGEKLYVLQDHDNDFYLHHDEYGAYSQNGSLFFDARNTLEPPDRNWLIYGHNMKSGAMFGRLYRYRERSFVEAHPYVVLTLLHERLYYEPIAVLDIETDESSRRYFRLWEFNFETDDDFYEYMHYFRDNAAYDIWQEPEPGDRILILVTCSYVYNNSRLIVVCRQVPDPYAAPEPSPSPIPLITENEY